MSLSTSPQIISLANSLGFLEGDPVESIRDYCLKKVKGFFSDVRRPRTMSDIESVVCAKLKLGVYRVWNEAELDELIAKYVGAGEFVFAALRQQLGDDAFGIFIKLNKPNQEGQPWVAIIDCRGEKRHKRHWTFWHEVTHCLTTVDQMQLPLRRTTVQDEKEKEPIEVLTDHIAKDLAFYGPLFNPILRRELEREDGRMSFALVERVRTDFCEDTSFTSTLNTCVERNPNPCMVLEAAPGFNKREISAINAGDNTVTPSLRVKTTRPNEAMRQLGVFIPQNYRVPADSFIARVYHQETFGAPDDRWHFENLGNWTDSSGRSLSPLAVYVQARVVGQRVTAIMGLA